MEILTLKKRKDFVRVAAQGLKMVTSSVIVQAAQNLSGEDDKIYVGYTTTRKLGKAHTRNRIRRRLRAAVRELFPAHAASGYTYVLIGRYNTEDCPYKTLCKDLRWGLKKIFALPSAHTQPVVASDDKTVETFSAKPSDSAD